ncbi:hypothetical protein TNCV_4998311 [Trichonephila clavipes]|nr:hypothetical protein TNCV_4998311 [Trichonephila clavipes]
MNPIYALVERVGSAESKSIDGCSIGPLRRDPNFGCAWDSHVIAAPTPLGGLIARQINISSDECRYLSPSTSTTQWE